MIDASLVIVLAEDKSAGKIRPSIFEKAEMHW